MNSVEISGLRKSFGRTVALDGLEMTVRTGEVHGFLGPQRCWGDHHTADRHIGR